MHWLTGSPNTKYSILCPPIAIYSDKPQSRIASLLKRIPRTRPFPPAGLFLSLFPPALQGVCFLATQAGQALTSRFFQSGHRRWETRDRIISLYFLLLLFTGNSEKHHPQGVLLGGGERIGPRQFRDNLVLLVFDFAPDFVRQTINNNSSDTCTLLRLRGSWTGSAQLRFKQARKPIAFLSPII